MHVPFWQRILTQAHLRWPHFFSRLGNLESLFFQKELEHIKIKKPIFITGFARSGSSILLNLLYKHTLLTSFTYQDYPFLMTPILWRYFLKFSTIKQSTSKVERIHQDRLKVNSFSPESFDEVFWKTFFSHLHHDNNSSLLTQSNRNSAFDLFYIRSIKKVLFLNSKKRFLCKNNYHFSRFEYLISLFPDARFVFLYRNPITHVGSLIKQHTLLSKIHHKNPATLEQFKYLCHFEFGKCRRVLSLTSPETEKEIYLLWNQGKAPQAWALYWDMIYRYILSLLQKFNQHIFLINYEDMCTHSDFVLTNLYHFLDLPISKSNIKQQSKLLTLPTYYQPNITVSEQKDILNLTDSTFQNLKTISHSNARTLL